MDFFFLSNTLYVPNLNKNLFSICNYDLEGEIILIKNQMYFFFAQDNTIFVLCYLWPNIYLHGSKNYNSRE